VTQPSPEAPRPIAAAIIVADRRVLLARRRVMEGQLSWQFPAGEVEVGESAEEAAAREAREEVGLVVAPVKVLGERIHPATKRTMVYIGCEVTEGTAHVADPDELDRVEWCDRAKVAEYVPFPLFEPVQDYLDQLVA
jgi:8-oxo-dGTP diphosphatase